MTNKEINLTELLLQHKNKIINAAIFILALFIAQNIYQRQIREADILKQKKDGELKRNAVLEDIQQLEKKIRGYKSAVNRKDLSVVMNIVSEIAQDFGLNVISIRPEMQDEKALYTRYHFAMKLESNTYHAVGRFVSKLESRAELYSVEKLEIRPIYSYESEKKWLSVELTVSTILLKE